MNSQAFLNFFRVQGQTSRVSGVSTTSMDGLVHDEDLGKDMPPHICKRQVSLFLRLHSGKTVPPSSWEGWPSLLDQGYTLDPRDSRLLAMPGLKWPRLQQMNWANQIPFCKNLQEEAERPMLTGDPAQSGGGGGACGLSGARCKKSRQRRWVNGVKGGREMCRVASVPNFLILSHRVLYYTSLWFLILLYPHSNSLYFVQGWVGFWFL